MEQLNDWNTKPDPETLDFHTRQAVPYRSTVHFGEFIRPFMAASKYVIDVGCGAGGPTKWLAEEFPSVYINGIDVSMELLNIAARNKPNNVGFSQCDVCSLPVSEHVNGVISLAMLSWMPDYKVPLDEICSKINPRWIAVSSLFYNGEISCRIVVDEPKRPRKSFHNIYSIPHVAAFMKLRGYRLAKCEPFEIDVDLPKPSDPDIMKSWTDEGMIFSGPLLLPWYFLAFEKIT